MVSGQLEESLRHEIESYIEGRLSGVKQEIAELQSQLNESLTRLLERQSEVQLDGAVAASIVEHLRAAHEEGIDLAAAESSRTKASSDMAIIKAAICEMSEQGSQADVLQTLINRAASFAPRIAFFAVKGDQAIGWRARGFQGTVGDNAIQQVSIQVSADSIIGDVARTRATWSGGPHSHSEDHIILNRFGEEAPPRMVAVPLIVRGRTVAVLYADSGEQDSETIKLEALETLVRVSGMAVELLAGRAPTKRPATESAQETSAPTESAPAYAPQREYEQMVPEISVEDSAPAPDTVEADSIGTAERAPEPFQASVESPGSSAAAAPADTAPGARRRYGMDVELPVAVENEEERRLHIDARRFARLLVSEIKLYNEQKVTDGRTQQDLYERLREYIDRSREMYDKRVKPEVAQTYDYFHHELVDTLAEGDADKLGAAYPGATVSA